MNSWLLRSVQNSPPWVRNGASTLFTWHRESNDVPIPWLDCFRFLGFSSSSSSSSLELSLEVWRQNLTGSTFTKVKGESINLMKTSYVYHACLINVNYDLPYSYWTDSRYCYFPTRRRWWGCIDWSRRGFLTFSNDNSTTLLPFLTAFLF